MIILLILNVRKHNLRTFICSSGNFSTTIYLLPSTETEEGNIYTEYGYVDNKWEEIKFEVNTLKSLN